MINLRALGLLLSALVGLMPMAGYGVAMQALSDDEMEDVSGAGIAVALENFRYMMAPTSYMEQVGVTPAGACTGVGDGAANRNCWRRGDLRWYGINLSGAENLVGSGSHWTESTCNPGDGDMNCPRGGVIGGADGWFSPFDNPYVMRAWSPQGMAHDGSLINTDPENPTKTIYEYLAPTDQPDYIMSFWGEIEVGATRDPALQPLSQGQGTSNTSGGGLLKSQTIIRGNAAGSVFRLFKYTETGANPQYGETFAMLYHSRLKGDFRFSVAQQAGSNSDAIGVPAQFAAEEGLHFRNVDAFLPIGQLYYQALVLNAIGTSGAFSLSLTRVPNNPTVFNRFYGRTSTDPRGFETARLQVRNWNTECAAGDVACSDYRQSHGYVRYGDWYPTVYGGTPSTGTRNGISSTDDGIFFRACPSCSDFRAYAARPIRIDKRGISSSMQVTQNYNCGINNAGGCAISGSSPAWAGPQNPSAYYTLQAGGPLSQGGGSATRTYPTGAVNLGDARIEGLLINQLDLISCQAGGGLC